MRWLEVRSHLAAVCDKHVFRADAQAEDLGCAVAEVDRLRGVTDVVVSGPGDFRDWC